MTDFAKKRAKNSLSRKKFLDRLGKGLPIFVAYGGWGGVDRYEDVRDLHLSTSCDFEFVRVSRPFGTGLSETENSLEDMNVLRNRYNHNFVFRTQWAADEWLRHRQSA